MKTKIPLKFGWLIIEKKYHIAIITTGAWGRPIYACLCMTEIYLDEVNPQENYNHINNFIWPNGVQCFEPLNINTICSKCLTLHGEDLTFPLIKAKLGVKNPFD